MFLVFLHHSSFACCVCSIPRHTNRISSLGLSRLLASLLQSFVLRIPPWISGTIPIHCPPMYQRSLGPGQGDPLGTIVVVLDSVFLSLAAVAICIRLWSRKIQGLGLYLNDYAAVLAWVWRRLVPFYRCQLMNQASRSRPSCVFADRSTSPPYFVLLLTSLDSLPRRRW